MGKENRMDWTDPRLGDLLVHEGQAVGIQLAPSQIEALIAFGEELERQNRRFNLSAIVDPKEVIRKHFVDSLALLPHLPSQAANLVDVGSGAGLPGLALKIARPELEVTLVESVKKKAAFLQETVARLELTGVNVIDRRAEELGQEAQFREQFALATARAVASLPVLLELSLPLLSVGGCFVAYKGPQVAEEIKAGQRALTVLGGELREVKEFALLGGERRTLVLVDKIAPTPAKYPRSPGRPGKRPL